MHWLATFTLLWSGLWPMYRVQYGASTQALGEPLVCYGTEARLTVPLPCVLSVTGFDAAGDQSTSALATITEAQARIAWSGTGVMVGGGNVIFSGSTPNGPWATGTYTGSFFRAANFLP